MKNNSDLFVGNRAEFEPIILLHGTFARDADWCKPGSDFCSELDAKLTDAGSPARCWYGIEHTFEDFKWSGENSQMARNADAFQLAMKLVSRLDANIGNIHIVAHSHAGNVVRRSLVHALYLLRGNRLASIVTIGTPFLINKEIKMRRGVFIEFLGIPIALLVPALIMIFVLALPFMTPVREWLTGGWGFPIALTICAILGFFLARTISFRAQEDRVSKDPVPFYSISSVFDEAIALLSSAAGIRDSRKVIARELVPFRARAFILDRLMESRSCRKLIRDLFERPSWKVFWNGILQHWDDEVPFESRSLTVSNFLYNTLFTALFVVEVLIFLPVSLLVMYFRRLALGIGILTLANRVLGNDDLRSSPRSVEHHAPGSGALTFPIEIDKKTEVALLRGAKPKDVDLFETLYSFGQSKIENVSDIYQASADVERVFRSAQLVHSQYMSNDNIIGMIADCISKSRDATG